MSTNRPDKRMRFANPKPLNLETRVLHDVIPGGVTVGEVDAAIQAWWRKAVSTENPEVPPSTQDPS